MWKGPDNPSGFFEDRDALGLNESLMMHIGTQWDDPEPWRLNSLVWRSSASTVVESYLRHRLNEFPLFALKEPRLCRLLPIWRTAIDRIGCRVSVVHVVRHPLAVADSLVKRDGMDRDRALALWLEYTTQAHNDVDPTWPSVTVCYETMMALPSFSVERIGMKLGLAVDGHMTRDFARSFVDYDLWHHAYTADEPLRTEVKVIYEVLKMAGKA